MTFTPVAIAVLGVGVRGHGCAPFAKQLDALVRAVVENDSSRIMTLNL